MKKSIIVIAAIFMTAFTSNVMAQGVTENTAASAKIVTPIQITETSALNFGTMSGGVAGGTCILSTSGVRTGTVNLTNNAPLASNAAYTVNGQISSTYAITLPSTITVIKPITLETMTIIPIARTASAAVDGVTGTLNNGGTDTFTVGGTLTVGANQASGSYSGTFDVTVNYN